MKYIIEVDSQQEPFKNSNREKRGQIVSILIESKKVSYSTLAKKIDIEENNLDKLIKGLERDGIVCISKNNLIEIKSN